MYVCDVMSVLYRFMLKLNRASILKIQALFGFAAQCVNVCSVTKSCNRYFVTQDKKKSKTKKKRTKSTNKMFSEHTNTQLSCFSLYITILCNLSVFRLSGNKYKYISITHFVRLDSLICRKSFNL